LPAVSTTYPTPPFLPFFHPRIELPGFRPSSHLDLHGGIDFPAISFGKLLHVVVAEVHN
jgi:hypothetical protein